MNKTDMKTVHFTIPGEPQGKARGRTFIHNKTGRFTTLTPAKTENYEALIKQTYWSNGLARFENMVEVQIKAYYTIPQSASKKKQQDMINGILRPTKKPDADNILKIVCDALNDIAYRDDTQVVRATVEKWYGEQPRVEVELREVS